MSDRALAVLFVLAIWWLSTGVVLRMVWLGRATFAASMIATTLLAAAGVVGMHTSSRMETTTGAYVAFASAIAVWAWHEVTFLFGWITGPSRAPCPPGAVGWRRFVHATNAIIHHEVVLAATLVALVALTWRAPNQVGTHTFLVLWIMRLSAKLNVFLGVRNFTEQFVPDHLRYLLSYFRKARLNALMPVSLVVGSVVAARLHASSFGETTPFSVVARSLVATILTLAVLEHLFLTLPVPDSLLWRWAIRKSARRGDRGVTVEAEAQ